MKQQAMRRWNGVIASLRPDDRVAVAVSGGADSVALAWLLHDLVPRHARDALSLSKGGAPQPGAPYVRVPRHARDALSLSKGGAPQPGAPYVRGAPQPDPPYVSAATQAGALTERGWSVVGLVHVNHGLRGPESDADEAFCRDLAARLSWPIHVESVDVRSRARERKQSTEAAARALRYECFERALDELGASVVATAHTMDDQAETVLLRLLRGAGLRGLSGVRQRRDRVVRPLLGYRRSDLRRFLAARGELFREDATNADLSIPRNQLRHEVMPILERFTPGAVRALARCASLAADDDAALGDIASRAAASVVVSPRTLDARALTELPAAVSRRVVRLMAERIAPDTPWSARHVEAVRMLASSVEQTETRQLDLPGTNIDRRGNVITFRAASTKRSRTAAFDRLLAVPGSTDIPEAGASIEVRTGPAPEMWPPVSNGMVAVLDGTSIAWPLRVRSRRPGDRLKPLGAPGRRKLQDLFVDRKVPRDARDRVPIVVDANGRILWVAGLVVAEECRVTGPGSSMVILELTTR